MFHIVDTLNTCVGVEGGFGLVAEILLYYLWAPHLQHEVGYKSRGSISERWAIVARYVSVLAVGDLESAAESCSADEKDIFVKEVRLSQTWIQRRVHWDTADLERSPCWVEFRRVKG